MQSTRWRDHSNDRAFIHHGTKRRKRLHHFQPWNQCISFATQRTDKIVSHHEQHTTTIHGRIGRFRKRYTIMGLYETSAHENLLVREGRKWDHVWMCKSNYKIWSRPNRPCLQTWNYWRDKLATYKVYQCKVVDPQRSEKFGNKVPQREPAYFGETIIMRNKPNCAIRTQKKWLESAPYKNRTVQWKSTKSLSLPADNSITIQLNHETKFQTLQMDIRQKKGDNQKGPACNKSNRKP